MPRTSLPLRPAAVLGVEALRRIDAPVTAPAASPSVGSDLPGLGPLLDALAATPRGVVLAMGKGGVGKTTLAARREAERYLDEVEALSSRRCVLPWLSEPPRGAEGLASLAGRAHGGGLR